MKTNNAHTIIKTAHAIGRVESTDRAERRIATRLLIVLAVVLLAPGLAFGQDANEVIQTADDQMMGDRFYSLSEIKTFRNDRARTSISFETYSMTIDGEIHSLSVYLAPPIMKGNAYLITGDNVWARFGMTGRVREMGKDVLTESADGTDFGFYDLGETSGGLSSLYEARMLEKRVRSEGTSCYKLELIPDTDEDVPYDRLVAFIARDDPRYVRIEYYRDGTILKNMVFLKYQRIDGRLYPFAYVMYSDIRNSRTEVFTEEVEFGSDKVEQDMFTVDYLKNMER